MLRALAEKRAALVSQLIPLAPGAAAELALPSDVAAQLSALAPQAVEVSGEWTGTLEQFIEDDFEHQTSRIHWQLRTAEGKYELYSSTAPREAVGASVSVRGLRSGTRIAVAGISVNNEASAAQCAATTGDQKVAVVLVNMPTKTLDSSVTKAAMQQMFFGAASGATADTVNSYWKEASYGKVSSVQGDVFGPFTLAQDYSCDQTDALTTAAVKAADGAADFTQYSRVVVVFKGPCNWSGLASLGCTTIDSPSKGTLPYSVVWLPSATANVAAHELGHNLGMQHASSDDYGVIPLGPPAQPGVLGDYGDPFDVMASSYTVNGEVIMGHYSAPHKVQLNWLASGEYLQTTTSGTFTLAPIEGNSGVRGLRIQREAGTDSWLWAEFRQETGTDSKLPLLRAFSNIVPTGSTVNVFDGALIHYEDPAYPSARARLLDFNPSSIPNKFGDAALAVGKSWSDPYSPLTLNVNRKDSNGLNLTVTYDEPCAQVKLDGSITASGGSGTLTVTAPSTCSWTASTTNSWIKLSGSTSRTGNAVIPVTIDANSGDQRLGSITVARQTTTFYQPGPGPSVLSVSPSVATGTSNLFTFQFSDSKGNADIKTVILSLGACEVRALLPDANPLYLRTGNTLNQLLFTPGNKLSNSACTIYADGGSVTANGNQLTITLRVEVPASSSPLAVSAQALDGNNVGSSQVRVGTWSTSSCTYSVTPGARVFSANGGSAFIVVATQNGCSWSVLGAPSWVTFGTGTTGSGGGQIGYQVSANATDLLRTATFTVAGVPYTVEQGSSSSILLPYSGSLAHLATGGDWTSVVTLVNTGAALSQARLDFFGDDGSSLAAVLNNPPAPSAQRPLLANSIARPLNSKSMLILDVTGGEALATGSGRLSTGAGIGGAAIFRYKPSGQEAVVPLETRDADSYLLAFDNTGGITTGLAISNIANAAATVTVVVKDDKGVEKTGGTIQLKAFGHMSDMLPTLFPSTANIRGTVEFRKPAGGRISVLGIRAAGSAITTIPVLANVTAGTGSLAHVAVGGDWQTTFTLVNTGTAAASAMLDFYDDNGAPLTLPLTYVQTGATKSGSAITETLAPGESRVISAGGGPLVVGSAQLITAGAIGGFAVFRYIPSSQEAVVPLETRNPASFFLGFDNTGSVSTGFALASVAGNAANVQVVIRNEAGATVDSGTIQLKGLGHTSFMLPTQYPKAAGLRGTVELITPAGAQISIVGLRASTNTSGAFAITTIPLLTN